MSPWGIDFLGEVNGEIRTRARALDNSVYVVVSMFAGAERSHPGRSSIVDSDGHILADAGYEPDTVAAALIDLDRKVYISANIEFAKVRDLRALLLSQRRPELYAALVAPTADALIANRYGGTEETDPSRSRSKEDVFRELSLGR
ncbi:MAG: hypothetical protein HYY08_03845 [Firmicutes bacterium]|nr:hypothetical protein [Bacillota bacterium]